MNVPQSYANGIDPSLEFWAYRVADGTFELDGFGVTDEWFYQRCRDLARHGDTLALTEGEFRSLFSQLAYWLGDIAMNGANTDAASVARDVFAFGIRVAPGHLGYIFWSQFMRRHRMGEALKPEHLVFDAMREFHAYLLDTFREFLSSPDQEVVIGGIVGLDSIWGEEKKQILRDFLATNPGKELRHFANGAMDSNLW